MITHKFKSIEVIASALLVNEQGELLLCRPHESSMWTLPSGHVGLAETLVDTVARGAKEEIGVDIEVMAQLCAGEFIAGQYVHFIYFAYLAKIKQGQEIKIDDEAIVDYKWILPDEALLIIDSSYKEQVKALIDRK